MTLEDCACSDAMSDLLNPRRSWRELEWAAHAIPEPCLETYLGNGTVDAVLERMRYDWEGFCEHLTRHRSISFLDLVIDALNPAANHDHLCAIDRLVRDSCTEAARLPCKIVAKRVEYALKNAVSQKSCALKEDPPKRRTHVYVLSQESSVTLDTASFGSGRHTLGRKKLRTSEVDTMNNVPAYGIGEGWPRTEVVGATLKLPGRQTITLDVQGMYDPGPAANPFLLERNGAADRYLLKARLGNEAATYVVEWTIRGADSRRTLIRAEPDVVAEPDSNPADSQIQADLPAEFRSCTLETASPWGYDSEGLDMIARLRCASDARAQVILRYRKFHSDWAVVERADPYARSRTSAARTPVAAPRVPEETYRAPVPPRTIEEPYPSADVQQRVMGLGNPPPAGDAPAAGTTIRAGNATKYAERLGPGLTWIVRNGIALKIAKYRRVVLPYALLAATEKNAASVSLDSKSMSPSNYVAGLPFPGTRAEEPDAALKLVWNFYSAMAADDLAVEPVVCDTGLPGKAKAPFRVDIHSYLQKIIRLYFTGRLEVDPKPELQPNRDGVRYKEALYPLIEPFDRKGMGAVTYRYLDTTHQDDSWLYTPQIRRVRRVSTAQRSDAIMLPNVDPDSVLGFSGSPTWFDWRVLAELTTVASLHDGGRNDKPEYFPSTTEWEPRKVWVLEAKPKVTGYQYSRRVIYLDQESLRVVRTETYDKEGQLWKIFVDTFRFPEAGPKKGPMSIGAESGAQTSTTVVDLRDGGASACQVGLRERLAGGGGWYVNGSRGDAEAESAYELSSPLGGR